MKAFISALYAFHLLVWTSPYLLNFDAQHMLAWSSTSLIDWLVSEVMEAVLYCIACHNPKFLRSTQLIKDSASRSGRYLECLYGHGVLASGNTRQSSWSLRSIWPWAQRTGLKQLEEAWGEAGACVPTLRVQPVTVKFMVAPSVNLQL